MKTQADISLTPNKEVERASGNYHQPQAVGTDQTVLIDPAVTAETDELDPSFQQGPPVDPEDDQDEDEDDFPAREDLEDEDFELNHDQDDDLSLNIDEDDLN